MTDIWDGKIMVGKNIPYPLPIFGRLLDGFSVGKMKLLNIHEYSPYLGMTSIITITITGIVIVCGGKDSILWTVDTWNHGKIPGVCGPNDPRHHAHLWPWRLQRLLGTKVIGIGHGIVIPHTDDHLPLLNGIGNLGMFWE